MISCLFCNKEIKKKNKFCNRSCAALYNNAKRTENGYSLKDKKKILKCLECHLEFEVGINSSEHIRCPECAYKKILSDSHVKNTTVINNCIICGVQIIGHETRKYCDSCLHNIRSENSKRTILLQGDLRRSKNEIYFADLCRQYFGNDDIKTNEPMFDGWDADIIIESYKIAVLWNGKWHYEKIAKKHSVAQVKNRDKIKISKIEAYNYIPYTIKDMGRFNKEFVKGEFSSMVELLSHTQNTTDRNR